MDWPLFDSHGLGTAEIGAGVAPACSGSSGVAGAWVELSAATADEIYGMSLRLGWVDNVADIIQLELGIGVSGSERSLFLILTTGNAQASNYPLIPWFPLYIPKGTRIAARATDFSSNSSAFIAIALQPTVRGFRAPTLVKNWTTISQIAISFDSPGSGWTELTSSLQRTAKWLLIGVGNPTPDVQFRVQLGVGAAGSEVAIYDSLMLTRPNYSYTQYRSVPCVIPAGVRVSAQLVFAAGGTGTTRVQHLSVIVGS